MEKQLFVNNIDFYYFFHIYFLTVAVWREGRSVFLHTELTVVRLFSYGVVD